MNCFTNYSVNQPIPINRRSNRCIYDNTMTSSSDNLAVSYQSALNYKATVLKNNSNSSKSTQKQLYSYLIQNPKTTYATQSDTVTNPNTKGLPQVNSTMFSVNNNATCPNIYLIYDPMSFPSYQPAIVYPIPTTDPIPIPQCANYVGEVGGTLIQSSQC